MIDTEHRESGWSHLERIVLLVAWPWLLRIYSYIILMIAICVCVSLSTKSNLFTDWTDKTYSLHASIIHDVIYVENIAEQQDAIYRQTISYNYGNRKMSLSHSMYVSVFKMLFRQKNRRESTALCVAIRIQHHYPFFRFSFIHYVVVSLFVYFFIRIQWPHSGKAFAPYKW